jgi:hypothetical protein
MPADGGGEAVQVTKLGGGRASESQDGQWLYYSRSEFDSSLWRVPTGGGQEQQVLDSAYAINFATGRDGIYFMRNTTGKIPIEFFDFASLKRTLLATLDKAPIGGFSVSPDERWILYTQLDEAWSGDLMLVENFR